MVTLLCDTRQKPRKHDLKDQYFADRGVNVVRSKLLCGDYALLTDLSTVVDTKFSIQELIGDIQVRQMSKADIKKKISAEAELAGISADLADQIYHSITDDDTDRYPEKEINDLCFAHNVSERHIAIFQQLYVKRHGFFHRGLKRAQNSGVKLYVLVENEDGIDSINDLFYWHNSRLDIWKTTGEVIGYTYTGRPKYKRVQKYPNAIRGEQIAKACLTMEAKYGVTFLFCKPEEAGARILNLLEKSSL